MRLNASCSRYLNLNTNLGKHIFNTGFIVVISKVKLIFLLNKAILEQIYDKTHRPVFYLSMKTVHLNKDYKYP